MNLAHDVIGAARKRHQCDWCCEAIEIGESYVRQRNVDGREVWTWRAHAECSRAAESLSADDLENSVGVTFTRGCTCERGQHVEGASCPCDLTPWTQETAKEAASA